MAMSKASSGAKDINVEHFSQECMRALAPTTCASPRKGSSIQFLLQILQSVVDSISGKPDYPPEDWAFRKVCAPDSAGRLIRSGSSDLYYCISSCIDS